MMRGSLVSFPRRREPITTDLEDTEYGSPPARRRRKRRADAKSTDSPQPGQAVRQHDFLARRNPAAERDVASVAPQFGADRLARKHRPGKPRLDAFKPRRIVAGR